jgi:putative SOS response-associated peptidase YedK
VRAVCGRFTLTTPPSVLARELELEAAPDLAPRFNVAPGQDVATLWRPPSASRALRLRRWGLVPHWARDVRIGSRLVNARAETAAEKPAFREALRLRRCLVPADGFYEWAGAGRGPRQPYHIAFADRKLFAIAGLFERWRAEAGEWLESCVLLTVAANEQIRPLHDRMPAILPRPDWEAWLDPELRDPARVGALLKPWAGEPFAPRPVSRRVNRTEHDDPECLAPLAGPV